LFRWLDRWLPLPPLSLIAVLGNPEVISSGPRVGWEAETEQAVMAGRR